MKTSLVSILSIAFIIGLSIPENAQEDSTCIVNGLVFEVEESRPLEGIGVRWHQLDSLGATLNVDSVLTDVEGKFSIILTKGRYSFYTQLENYRGCVSHTNLQLTDSTHLLEFAVYHPVISVSPDSLLIPVDPENPVRREISVHNVGSGKVSFNSILDLRDKVPEDLTQINEGGVCDTLPEVYYGQPEDSDWKYLVQDRQDQDSGSHDIKSVSMQQIEGTFYLKFELFEVIGTFEDLDLELWFDSDPADNSGHPEVGFEYLIYISAEPGYLVAPLLNYANGNYLTLSSPVYSDIQEENNYLVVGYPGSYLCQYDVILATAFSRGGNGESAYEDFAPERGTGNIVFTVKSHPFIELGTFYGEATEGGADTLTLTVDPGVQNDTLNSFYLGIVSEDEVTPIIIVPVQLQKALSVNNPTIASPEVPDFTVYPNPSESDITLHYVLNNRAKVILSVSDLQGRTINTLFNGTQEQAEDPISRTDADPFQFMPWFFLKDHSI